MAGQNGRSLVGRIQGQGCCIGKLDAVQTVCSGLAQVPLTDEHGTAVPGTLIHPVCQKALQEAHCQKRAAVRLPRKVLHLPGCCWSCATIERKRRPAPRRQWGRQPSGAANWACRLAYPPCLRSGPACHCPGTLKAREQQVAHQPGVNQARQLLSVGGAAISSRSHCLSLPVGPSKRFLRRQPSAQPLLASPSGLGRLRQAAADSDEL